MGVSVTLVALTPGGISDPSSLAWAVLNAPFAIIAIVILVRRPGNRIGWILMTLGLLAALPLGAYGALALASGLPGGPTAFLLSQSIWAPAFVLVGAGLLLRFPTGTLPSPAWRWFEWLAIPVGSIPVIVFLFYPGDFGEFGFPGARNPLGIDWLGEIGSAAFTLFLLVPLVVAIGVASLLFRFRRSSGVERQQLKWLTAAAFLIGMLYVVGMVGGAINDQVGDGSVPVWLEVIQDASANAFVFIPIAIGLAILRYRLYDIDRFISRTLSYAIVTVILGAVFVVVVVGLQALALPFTGGSELAIALSTVTVAALFGPVRRRVQQAVDRRFDRARYDGARVAEDFGTRLRDRLDLDDLSTDLLATAEQALRPATASVWVRQRKPTGTR
jgi:hypothetical protein